MASIHIHFFNMHSKLDHSLHTATTLKKTRACEGQFMLSNIFDGLHSRKLHLSLFNTFYNPADTLCKDLIKKINKKLHQSAGSSIIMASILIKLRRDLVTYMYRHAH